MSIEAMNAIDAEFASAWGRYIAAYLDVLDMPQSELARRTGFSRTLIARFVGGRLPPTTKQYHSVRRVLQPRPPGLESIVEDGRTAPQGTSCRVAFNREQTRFDLDLAYSLPVGHVAKLMVILGSADTIVLEPFAIFQDEEKGLALIDGAANLPASLAGAVLGLLGPAQS